MTEKQTLHVRQAELVLDNELDFILKKRYIAEFCESVDNTFKWWVFKYVCVSNAKSPSMEKGISLINVQVSIKLTHGKVPSQHGCKNCSIQQRYFCLNSISFLLKQ